MARGKRFGGIRISYSLSLRLAVNLQYPYLVLLAPRAVLYIVSHMCYHLWSAYIMLRIRFSTLHALSHCL